MLPSTTGPLGRSTSKLAFKVSYLLLQLLFFQLPSFTSSEVGLLRICHVSEAEIKPAPFYLQQLNSFEPECYPTQVKSTPGV